MNIFIEDFRQYFEQYGRILSAEVMYNRETRKSRGFGFVIFDSEDSIKLAIENDEHIINGKVVSFELTDMIIRLICT